jgi:hypothetical protein
MENLDIFILTSVVATLFVVFFVTIYRELSTVDENSYKYEKEGGPRVALFNMMARLFEDEEIPKKEKKVIYKAMHKTIADMESDGIYFPEDIKEELKKQREELTCEYSGLPSIRAYSDWASEPKN